MFRQDNVGLIVDRLRQIKGSDQHVALIREISGESIQETQNALRVFNVQHANRLGKHDNPLKRAAALLEYITRQLQGIKLPMQLLAKASNAKNAKEFEAFHDLVGNLRGRSSNRPSKQQPGHGNNASTNLRKGTGIQNSASASSSTISSLPILAIKLAPYVADSNGVAQRAQALLQDWKTRRPSKKGHNNKTKAAMAARHQKLLLQDMQQHQATYEAVCFFLIARRGEKQQRKAKATTAANNNHHDERESNLTVETLLKFTTDFTHKEFQRIYEFVSTSPHMITSLLDESSHSKTDSTATSIKPTSKQPFKGTNNKRPTANVGASTKEKRTKTTTTNNASSTSSFNKEDHDDPNWAMTLANNTANDDYKENNNNHNDDDDEYYSPSYYYSMEFQKWKNQILNAVVQTTMAKDQDSSTTNVAGGATRTEALHQAALQALQRHGF